MSILTNDVGIVEADRDRLKTENDSLKSRMAEQAGALRESRAQNRELILRNEKLSAQIARLYKHLRDSLGSAEHIVKAQAELEPELPGVPDFKGKSPPPNSILSKLTRLNLKTEVAA